MSNKKNIELSKSLAQLLRTYLLSRKSENLRQATIDNYNFILTAFMRYMLDNDIAHIEDVTTNFIRQYKLDLQESGMKPSSIDAHHRCLSTFFNWLCVDQELIDKNPMLKVKKTKYDIKQKPTLWHC